MSIKLSTDTAVEIFTDSNSNLEDSGNFKTVLVEAGTWIFYTYANFNDAQYGGTLDNFKVLKPGDNVSIESVNGSMRLVRDATQGLILFEHSFYGGRMEVRAVRVKLRLNLKTTPRYATSAGICFSVACTAYWLVESFFKLFCRDASYFDQVYIRSLGCSSNPVLSGLVVVVMRYNQCRLFSFYLIVFYSKLPRCQRLFPTWYTCRRLFCHKSESWREICDLQPD